jgi:type II secretory pathway component GspD/PulD (secretin)
LTARRITLTSALLAAIALFAVVQAQVQAQEQSSRRTAVRLDPQSIPQQAPSAIESSAHTPARVHLPPVLRPDHFDAAVQPAVAQIEVENVAWQDNSDDGKPGRVIVPHQPFFQNAPRPQQNAPQQNAPQQNAPQQNAQTKQPETVPTPPALAPQTDFIPLQIPRFELPPANSPPAVLPGNPSKSDFVEGNAAGQSESLAAPTQSTAAPSNQPTTAPADPTLSNQLQLQQPALLPEPQTPPRYELQPNPNNQVQVQSNGNGRVTIIARDSNLTDILNMLAEKEELSFVHTANFTSRVSIALRDIPLENALTALLSVAGYTWTENNGIIYVSSLMNINPAVPEVNGRDVRVFQLDFASGTEVNNVVQGMLSAVGKSYVMEIDPADNRKTGEAVIVEDLPGSLERISQYICQIDQPPRQVLIEAYVLEIDLRETERHGVNFEHLLKISGNQLRMGTLGTDPSGNSTFFAELDAPNLKGVIEALKTSTDAKTLASPKILAINGQQSRLQVGQQLGFRVLTTTQTSTLEDVRFLDVGVVLNVTPRISRDGQVMLKVKPEVSSGQINPDTGLPEEETSEVETNVLLANGKGMIIGGLIQEKNIATQNKVPKLGDIKYLGHFFRRTQTEVSRSEIIFVLMPRIVEASHTLNEQDYRTRQRSVNREQREYEQATTSVVDYYLHPTSERIDVDQRNAETYYQETSQPAFQYQTHEATAEEIRYQTQPVAPSQDLQSTRRETQQSAQYRQVTYDQPIRSQGSNPSIQPRTAAQHAAGQRTVQQSAHRSVQNPSRSGTSPRQPAPPVSRNQFNVERYSPSR